MPPRQTQTAKPPTLTQRYNALREDMVTLRAEHQRVTEYMSSAMRDLLREDIQWADHGNISQDYTGFDLKKLKKWSNDIRASYTGSSDGTKAPNPHIRNGFMLRHSFIWDGDIHYEGLDSYGGGVRGKKNLKEIIEGTRRKGLASENESHRLVFGSSARRKREFALFADGIYILVGDDKTKTLRPIPLHEITDVHRDAEYEDDIVAYRWTRKVAMKDESGRPLGGNQRTDKHEWVYVDWYSGPKPDAIVYGSVEEPVLKGHTAFDFHANRPDGQSFGSPDAIAAVVWARIIRDLIMNGVRMQDALAMFAFKATAPGKDGQKGASLELAKASEAGAAAVLGGDTDFTSLNTAGKGYDFSSIGFVVSTMAASRHVSGISLSANTALAGSSYGAAKTLDLPGRMAMEVRRREHVEYDERLLRWMGAPDASAYFNSYDDATDEYRAVQAAYLIWQSGRISPDQFGEMIDNIYGHKITGGIPNGILIPNNVKSLEKQEATKPEPTSAPAPGQGQSDGTGGSEHVNDPQSAK